MRKALKSKLYLIILSVLFFAACQNKEEHVHQDDSRYTCPMHPQIVTTEPGICPICKMDLVPLSGHGQVSANDSLKYLVKPTNEFVQSSVATVKPQSGKRFGGDIIRGVINYNTNNWKSISSRVGGRIEKLYVKYNYQPVNKGQKIMDIYSPDLANAQQELLFLKENAEPALLESAKRKLRLLGVTDQQIRATLRTGKIDYTIGVYSPYSGYISEGSVAAIATPNASPAGGTMVTGGDSQSGAGMGSEASTTSSGTTSSLPSVSSNSAISLREGQYVTAGQALFKLVNASSVWAEFFLRPEQLDVIRKGSEIEVTSSDDPGLNSKAKVSLVQPYYNEGSNFTVARALISNAGNEWKVGQIVDVSMVADGVAGTWIPRKAVLQLGSRFVIFVKKEGGFVPTYIEVSNRMGDWVDIGNNISANTEIAANAWFLVDSESFIQADSLKQ